MQTRLNGVKKARGAKKGPKGPKVPPARNSRRTLNAAREAPLTITGSAGVKVKNDSTWGGIRERGEGQL